MSETIVTKRFDGRMYVSSNGQLVVDQHATDGEHLLASQTNDSQPLYDCRVYLKDLIPEEWIGKSGRFVVVNVVDCLGSVAGVQIIFFPQ